jgi:hypothetical protein
MGPDRKTLRNSSSQNQPKAPLKDFCLEGTLYIELQLWWTYHRTIYVERTRRLETWVNFWPEEADCNYVDMRILCRDNMFKPVGCDDDYVDHKAK